MICTDRVLGNCQLTAQPATATDVVHSDRLTWQAGPVGRLDHHIFDSALPRDNPLGDTNEGHFELFDAGHGGIDYRYPLSLAWLAERLAR
jgi:hypothetical protein